MRDETHRESPVTRLRGALSRRISVWAVPVAAAAFSVCVAVSCGSAAPQPVTSIVPSPTPAATAPAKLTLPTVPLPGTAAPKTIRYSRTHLAQDFAYVTGIFESDVCHLQCTYLLKTTLPPGFDQAEVLLTGWDVYNLGRATTLRTLDVSSVATAYDGSTGAFRWSAAAELRSQLPAGDEFSFKLYFTIALMRSAGGRFETITNSCGAATGGECSAQTTSANLAGPEQVVGAVGVRRFRLESPVKISPSGLSLSRMSVDASDWQISGADLTSVISCALKDASPTEEMSCGTETLAMIINPSEAAGTKYESLDQSDAFLRISSSEPSPPGTFMDAFGGLTGFDLYFLDNREAQTWRWAANYLDILICPGKTDFCDYRTAFIGDKMDYQDTLKFEIRNKGFALWIIQ